MLLAVDAPAGPAWTKSLIAARVVTKAERQVWLARAVQDLEGGLDAAAFRAKPVIDAVAYVIKGLAAGNDRDWVVSSDECSTLEMWGAAGFGGTIRAVRVQPGALSLEKVQ